MCPCAKTSTSRSAERAHSTTSSARAAMARHGLALRTPSRQMSQSVPGPLPDLLRRQPLVRAVVPLHQRVPLLRALAEARQLAGLARAGERAGAHLDARQPVPGGTVQPLAEQLGARGGPRRAAGRRSCRCAVPSSTTPSDRAGPAGCALPWETSSSRRTMIGRSRCARHAAVRTCICRIAPSSPAIVPARSATGHDGRGVRRTPGRACVSHGCQTSAGTAVFREANADDPRIPRQRGRPCGSGSLSCAAPTSRRARWTPAPWRPSPPTRAASGARCWTARGWTRRRWPGAGRPGPLRPVAVRLRAGQRLRGQGQGRRRRGAAAAAVRQHWRDAAGATRGRRCPTCPRPGPRAAPPVRRWRCARRPDGRAAWTLLDHPMLALDVAGSPAFWSRTRWSCTRTAAGRSSRSSPSRCWTVRRTPAKVGAAARQAAVYVLALEEVAAGSQRRACAHRACWSARRTSPTCPPPPASTSASSAR